MVARGEGAGLVYILDIVLFRARRSSRAERLTIVDRRRRAIQNSCHSWPCSEASAVQRRSRTRECGTHAPEKAMLNLSTEHRARVQLAFARSDASQQSSQCRDSN